MFVDRRGDRPRARSLIAMFRASRAPWLFPLRAVLVRLHRRVSRHPDDPARVPRRLRHPGAPGLGPRQGVLPRPRRCRPIRSCSACVALALSYSAYVAEVYRAGIDSVHAGQTSAALALGLTRNQALRFVVVPQAVRSVLPPLLNDFIALQKDVALVSILGVVEAFQAGEIYSPAALQLHIADRRDVPVSGGDDPADADARSHAAARPPQARDGDVVTAAVLEVRGVTKALDE